MVNRLHALPVLLLAALALWLTWDIAASLAHWALATPVRP